MRHRFVTFGLGVASTVSTVALGATPPASPPPAASSRLYVEAPGGTITFEGRYPSSPGTCAFKQRRPLRAVYRGRLEFSPDGSRIRVIDEVDFSDYLRGLAEVPPSWPDAALRAQAIAARSYALDAIRRGTASRAARGYDICATDQCQVYRGAAVELGAFGERWARAVTATRGTALTYKDRVIQAFYFSTSTGRTRSAFPGGTPQPWLPSVSGEDDGAPLARWTASIRLTDLAAIMRARGITSGTPITRVRRSGDTIRITDGAGSHSLAVAAFRAGLNAEAPCLFPDRYPSTGSATGGKLPQTVPSQVFTLARRDDAVVLRGRGWGHGVGMSQWGAREMASRGASAREILSHFYGPARVRRVEEPATIRVLAAEDLRRVRLSSTVPIRITTDTGSVLAPGLRFEVRGGSGLQILRGRGPSLAPALGVSTSTAALRARPGVEFSIRFELSAPARVRALISGSSSITTPSTSFVACPGEILLTIPKPGNYRVIVEAFDGLDRVRARAVPVIVTAPLASRASRTPAVATATAAALLATAAVARARRLRRKRARA